MFTLSHNIKFPIKQEKKCEYFIFKDIQNNETIGFFKCLVVNQACYIDICILKHRSDCDTIDQCLKLVFEYIKKLNVDHIFFGKHFFIDRMHKLNYNFNIKNELAIFKNKHYIECEKSKW
jgi:hypothetical protein